MDQGRLRPSGLFLDASDTSEGDGPESSHAETPCPASAAGQARCCPTSFGASESSESTDASSSDIGAFITESGESGEPDSDDGMFGARLGANLGLANTYQLFVLLAAMYLVDRDEFWQLIEQPLFKQVDDTVYRTTEGALALLRSQPWQQQPRCELQADLDTRSFCTASHVGSGPSHCGACGQPRDVHCRVSLAGYHYDAAEFNRAWKLLSADHSARLASPEPQSPSGEDGSSLESVSESATERRPRMLLDDSSDGESDSGTEPSCPSLVSIGSEEAAEVAASSEKLFRCTMEALATPRGPAPTAGGDMRLFGTDLPSDDCFNELVHEEGLLTHTEWWQLACRTEETGFEMGEGTILDLDRIFHGVAPYSLAEGTEASCQAVQDALEFVLDPDVRRHWGHISRRPGYLVGRWCMHRLMVYHKMMHFKLRVLMEVEQELLMLPLLQRHSEAYRPGDVLLAPEIRQSLAYLVASDAHFVRSVMARHQRLVRLGRELINKWDRE